MRIIGWVGVAVAVVAFAAGRVSAGEGDRPAAPATVKALRYRLKIVEGTMDLIHGGGVECDEIFLPGKRVVANVTFEMRGDVGKPIEFVPVLHAFFGEARTSQYDLASKETRVLPTEEVEVPAELAERIVALAELTARLEKSAHDLGADGVKAKVFREAAPAAAGK